MSKGFCAGFSSVLVGVLLSSCVASAIALLLPLSTTLAHEDGGRRIISAFSSSIHPIFSVHLAMTTLAALTWVVWSAGIWSELSVIHRGANFRWAPLGTALGYLIPGYNVVHAYWVLSSLVDASNPEVFPQIQHPVSAEQLETDYRDLVPRGRVENHVPRVSIGAWSILLAVEVMLAIGLTIWPSSSPTVPVVTLAITLLERALCIGMVLRFEERIHESARRAEFSRTQNILPAFVSRRRGLEIGFVLSMIPVSAACWTMLRAATVEKSCLFSPFFVVLFLPIACVVAHLLRTIRVEALAVLATLALCGVTAAGLFQLRHAIADAKLGAGQAHDAYVHAREWKTPEGEWHVYPPESAREPLERAHETLSAILVSHPDETVIRYLCVVDGPRERIASFDAFEGKWRQLPNAYVERDNTGISLEEHLSRYEALQADTTDEWEYRPQSWLSRYRECLAAQGVVGDWTDDEADTWRSRVTEINRSLSFPIYHYRPLVVIERDRAILESGTVHLEGRALVIHGDPPTGWALIERRMAHLDSLVVSSDLFEP